MLKYIGIVKERYRLDNNVAHANFSFALHMYIKKCFLLYGPHREKTCLLNFLPGPTPTGLCSYRRWLEACKYEFWTRRGCTFNEAKSKRLVSCKVTVQLICAFVFTLCKK